ncbi:MAG: dethiobiotin synthase [Aquificae bacterium]|nr:dethiobiotin synthase [Aquificota bacterium]
MSKTIFVTATDTGVGKTTVSAALANLLKERKKHVGYFKPIETGCQPIPQDAKLLSKITGQPLEEVVLYTFRQPVAPYVAEKIERKSIDVQKIIKHFFRLKQKYEYLIIEGAGGICVPITKIKNRFYTYVDLIKDIKAQTLLVARGTLGTINHTCMTVKILKENEIKLIGIILNLFEENDDVSQNTNSIVIMEMTGVPVLAKCKKTNTEPIQECKNSLQEKLERILKL